MPHLLRPWPRFATGYEPQETDISVPVPGFTLSGMDTDSLLNEMDPGKARLVQNLMIRQGAYKLRSGVGYIGTSAASIVIGVRHVQLANGTTKLVRFCVDRVEVWDGTAWVATTGTVTGVDFNNFISTGWGDTVIFASGTSFLYQLSFNPNAVTTLAGAPPGIRHLTTFGGRVVAITQDGIYWTVKNNSTDWAGLGSGFEDLKSAPEGVSDTPTAVVPMTDEFAMHVRSKSIWQMTLTGDFDAPFSFSKLPIKAGSKYPKTCLSVGKAVMCVGDDGAVWLISSDDAINVGMPIESRLLYPETRDLLWNSFAAFDLKNHEYRLCATSALITVNGIQYTQTVLRFNLDVGSWTEDRYPFVIRDLFYTDFYLLPDPDGKYLSGFLYAQLGYAGGPGRIVRDDPSREDNLYRDVNDASADVYTFWRIETGHIKRTDDGLIKDFYEMILWYQADMNCTLRFEYSTDDGTTWTQWFSLPITTNMHITPLSVTVPVLSRPFIQLAIHCDIGQAFRMNKLEVWMRESGRIVDAS